MVGQSRWTTDWNFVQPCVVDSTGFYNDSSSTITFQLPSTPSGTASFYLALASDFQGAIEVSINGTPIAGGNGYTPIYAGSGNESDATIRAGIHGLFSDNRINCAANLLQTGVNTINISMRQTSKVNGNGYFADHAMYDYVRLELTGYVPPASPSVTTCAGNGQNLICWPVQPGAVSYNLLRSTNSGSGFAAITNGIIGPICGSGWNNATFLDTNVVKGVTYSYMVQSANAVGSTNSPPSAGATPSGATASNVPAAPASVSIGSVAHQSVTLNWSASSGANYYTVYRSTLFDNGGGASNVLGTIVLNNTNTTTSFTDTAVTDGTIYYYFVTATSAAGTSTSSVPAVAVPLPAPPASAPGSFSGLFNGVNVVLNWSPVASGQFDGSGNFLFTVSNAVNPNQPQTFYQLQLQ